MESNTAHIVEFAVAAGGLVPETVRTQIPARDPSCVVNVPAMAYKYRFLDMAVTIQNGAVFTSESGNKSGWYYLPPCRVLTLQQVEAGDDLILAENMRTNGWEHVIETRLGNWQPFLKGDLATSMRPEVREVKRTR